MFVSDKRLCLTADGRVVEEGHEDARTLLVCAGGVLNDEEAAKHGLTPTVQPSADIVMSVPDYATDGAPPTPAEMFLTFRASDGCVSVLGLYAEAPDNRADDAQVITLTVNTPSDISITVPAADATKAGGAVETEPATPAKGTKGA